MAFGLTGATAQLKIPPSAGGSEAELEEEDDDSLPLLDAAEENSEEEEEEEDELSEEVLLDASPDAVPAAVEADDDLMAIVVSDVSPATRFAPEAEPEALSSSVVVSLLLPPHAMLVDANSTTGRMNRDRARMAPCPPRNHPRWGSHRDGPTMAQT